MAKREVHPITIVYTESGMCLTTAVYSHWREVQDAFTDYKASLGPYTVDELIEFLELDFPTDPPLLMRGTSETSRAAQMRTRGHRPLICRRARV